MPHTSDPDVREALFGGQGTVQVWNLLAEHSLEPAPFTAALSCELSPGGSVGAHVQDAFAELVIGLEGAGEASVDRRPQALGVGDVVYLPLGAVLELRNLSTTAPLRYLIIKARG